MDKNKKILCVGNLIEKKNYLKALREYYITVSNSEQERPQSEVVYELEYILMDYGNI